MTVNIADLKARSKRREDAYRAHFEGCPDCPAAADGECARAIELRESWDRAREAFALQCEPPAQLKPERRQITYTVEPGQPDGYPVWEVARHKGNNSREVAVYTDAAVAESVRATLQAAAKFEDR